MFCEVQILAYFLLAREHVILSDLLSVILSGPVACFLLACLEYWAEKNFELYLFLGDFIVYACCVSQTRRD